MLVRRAHCELFLARLELDRHSTAEVALHAGDGVHALLGFEMMGKTDQGATRRACFETATSLYVSFYVEHMHIEETEVLPLAEANLSADDWSELDCAFLDNRDPLTGFDAVAAYQPLFKKILQPLPNSDGVGSVLEALAGAGPPRYGWPP
jgi:hypothetical protein